MSIPLFKGLYKYWTKSKGEKRKMIKRIAIFAIAIILCMGMMPVALSATTVTGTFTPLPTGISISCNNTAPAFGNINLNSEKEVSNFNLSNDGDTNCSVTMTAIHSAGTWTLVAGTSSPATTNQYCVNMDPNDAGYVDVQAQKTIVSDLPPSGAGTNYTKFDLKVIISQFTDEGAPAQQTFFANLTASAIS